MAQTNQDTLLTEAQRLNLLPDHIREIIEYTDGIRHFVNQHANGGNAIANPQLNGLFQAGEAMYHWVRNTAVNLVVDQAVDHVVAQSPEGPVNLRHVANHLQTSSWDITSAQLRTATANMVRGFTMQLRDVYQQGVNQAADHFVNSFNDARYPTPFAEMAALITQQLNAQRRAGQPFSTNLLQTFRNAVQGNIQAINRINNLRGVAQLHIDDDGTLMLPGNNGNNQGPPNGGGVTGAQAQAHETQHTMV